MITENKTISIAVVDDDASIRAALADAVDGFAGCKCVGRYSSGGDALTGIPLNLPDVVLMDINMPGMNGVEATRQIVAAEPDTVVILCSTYTPQDLPPDASTSGARAYVNKEEFAPAQLMRIWAERETIEFLPT
jgi:DNA-binding NarL/FixJ family response regulator